MKELILVLIGLSSGIMVGAGVISILVLVGVIPRMAQVGKTVEFINFYEKILIIGALFGSLISIQQIKLNLGIFVLMFFGICYGIFVGFLSSGLTEVLDYIPTVSRRLKIPVIYLKFIIISLILGKVIGSFVGWSIIKGG